MPSTMDQMVEAGALSDAAFDGRDWSAMGRGDRERYRDRSRVALRAAVPILGKDLRSAIGDATAGHRNDEAEPDFIAGCEDIEARIRSRLSEIMEGK